MYYLNFFTCTYLVSLLKVKKETNKHSEEDDVSQTLIKTKKKTNNDIHYFAGNKKYKKRVCLVAKLKEVA